MLMYVRQSGKNSAQHMILMKERSKDVRYEKFREVSPDCVERFMLQSGLTSFYALFVRRQAVFLFSGHLRSKALFQAFPHITEGGVLPLILQNPQHFLKLCTGLRVNGDVLPRVHEIIIGGRIGISIFQVDFAGCQAVAEHLRHIAHRHFVPRIADLVIRCQGIIHPVFKVVPVAPLVMQPGLRDPLLQPLGIVRAAKALIILCSAPEFFRGILAEVVGQSLTDQAKPEAVPADQMPMLSNRSEMRDRMHCLPSPSFFGLPLPPAALSTFRRRSAKRSDR